MGSTFGKRMVIVGLCSVALTAPFVNKASGQAVPSPAAAPDAASNPQQIYTEALAAFQNGEWQKAITGLQGLLAQVTDGPQLESVYYSLGAAYYNLQDYPKAIETLKLFQTKFPKSNRLGDVILFIGQANLANKNYPAALENFKQAEGFSTLRTQALLLEGTAYKESGDVKSAQGAYEKLIQPGIKDSDTANAAMLLVGIYADGGETDKATKLLELVREKLALVDNVVRVNALAVELGDKFLQNQQPEEALNCYRIFRTSTEINQFQADRISAMGKELEQNLAAIRSTPARLVELLAKNTALREQIASAKKLSDDFKSLPDSQPALLLRMGSAFYQMGGRWEAIVVYEDFLKKYPELSERETALFGLIVASAEVNRIKKTREYCEQYLKDFPTGPNVSAVGYLLGSTAVQSNDAAAAETYFGRILVDQPDSTYREEIRFQLGNARFSLGKYDDAEKDYVQYQKDYPQGTHFEESVYRSALAALFAGKYQIALDQLNSYVGKFPSGSFLADAKYRIAVCLYAAEEYDMVIATCSAWEKNFGADALRGEVLALHADSLAAQSKLDEAIANYTESYKVATTDEVMNYSLFAAQKLLLKKGNWTGIGEMFEEFVKDHPDNPSAVTAVYWIGKARVHDGKTDEAKKYIAGTIKKYISDPKRDSVEQLISQLAQLCVRKKPAAPAPEPAATSDGTTAASTPEPTPETAPIDPGAELDALLGSATSDQSPTAKARILYAKAELARLRKQIPEQEKNLQAIAEKFKPEDLSPMLLAQVGDYLLSKNKVDLAAPIFQRLMDNYPKSDLLDFAYNGLGEVAFQKKEYEKALRLFSDAIDQIGATTKLKDVTVGRAKTLLALGKLDEARKIFEQVASIREWRGESTAFSVYSLGEIAQKQDKLPEAIANYQRVYVAYRRFLPWVAKAYIKSAECFEKLGKPEEAKRTYFEMLSNEKLATFPEAEVARQKMGQG